ncbi:MAG: putative polymerase, sigma-24 subunit, subfamily [Pseudonocardia sp.]|nr:putative polymerase, sigma-24 subunit, subfamily [Pseudonocardia sp.]
MHDDARVATETDCPQILAWDDELLAIADNPAAALSRAVAVGKVDGPLAGLRALDRLDTRLRGQHRLDAVRAYLHEQAGHLDTAAEHYALAVGGRQQHRRTQPPRQTGGQAPLPVIVLCAIGYRNDARLGSQRRALHRVGHPVGCSSLPASEDDEAT